MITLVRNVHIQDHCVHSTQINIVKKIELSILYVYCRVTHHHDFFLNIFSFILFKM